MASNTTITPSNSTSIITTSLSTTLNQTIKTSTKKAFFIQGQDIIHKSFSKFDLAILLRATIILATITCVVLMFIGVKTYLLRRRRQTRKYKLLSSATRMEEPLFNGNDDEEEEKEDDTLFVRK